MQTSLQSSELPPDQFCRQNSQMQKPLNFDSTTHNMEVFCHMLLEEFLTTRSMHSTLRAFRKEWERPTEVCHV